ncbi:MAG: hypothetical protein M5U16_01105 [Hyphomicrobium sp.]|nr:hypothetical protein [Hyphomicrobium sp.]
MIERLRCHFDDDGIVELTALIAFQNMSSKFNSALGVPAQGFCRLPADRLTAKSTKTVILADPEVEKDIGGFDISDWNLPVASAAGREGFRP